MRARGLVRTVLTALHPSLFDTGRLLAEVVTGRARPGDRVLDLGTGGRVALAAARHGAAAYAVDRSAAAVRETRVKAMLDRVEVLAWEGELFAPLAPGTTFDTIAFDPSSGLDVERFLAEAPAFLAPGGVVLVAGSTEALRHDDYVRHGWRWHTVARRERIAERLVVDLLSRP